MTLKDKLTALCESRRWERYDLLPVVGDVSKSTIDNWFRGKHKPGLVAALRIAREFGVPLDYLADDAQDEPQPTTITADEERVLWLIRELGLSSGELARRLAGEPGGKAREGGVGRVIADRDLSEIERRKSGLKPDSKDAHVAEGKNGGPGPGGR